MGGLKLHTGNRLELLARLLADTIRRPLASPFSPELVLVQSQGMARWLKLQLATHHGICSNVLFPFPRAFAHSAFRAAIPDLPQEISYEADLLTWRVMRRLPALLADPDFLPLQRYLGDGKDDRKLFQLSQRIGMVLDQYLVFRPEMILEWESGKGGGWQGTLWRDISESFRAEHPAALRLRFLQMMRTGQVKPERTPERVSIFGISALPRFYLELFAELSSQVEVNLFLLESCREFWGYIKTASEQASALKRAGRRADEADALHLETGNRLLASMGKLGRDFLLLLQETGEWQETDESSLFAEPGEDSLLHCLQSDILQLRNRGEGEESKFTVQTGDTSVQVHSCHSPLRELEVLYDQILDWCRQDPSLAPGDILVMIPDIEEYGPLVHAVFGSPEKENLHIPYSVADRSAKTQSHLIESFLGLLALAESRLSASAVLALLEAGPVRRRFQLTESDLELVRHWVEQVRVRWGRDAEQRAELGLPSWNENTWRHGLNRLLLGYAMTGREQHLFNGILPFDDMEGGTTAVLGRLAEFLEALFTAVRELRDRKTLVAWADSLHTLVDRFFQAGEDEANELVTLESAFDKLRRGEQQTGFDTRVSLGVVLEQLNRDLGEDRFGSGYLTGGVTFCALKPMRSIPSKVICLLGMNDRAFPRAEPRLSFDLMSETPQPGDRSSREDDRYLFLETLISARERLYISYVGQSNRDNSVMPPSVVVSELLDCIGQGYELSAGDLIRDQVLFKQRLQAFSPVYFSGGPLFSYSRENLQASTAGRASRSVPARLIADPLPEPEAEYRDVSLRAFKDFLGYPTRFLATRRLGIKLMSDTAPTEDREPFAMDSLDNYQLKTELLDLKLQGLDLRTAAEVVRASGRLPAGLAGDAHFGKVRREVQRFWESLEPHRQGSITEPRSFSLEIGGFKLSGSFSQVTANGLLFFRPASIKPKDLLGAWLEHLVWNLVDREGRPATSVLVGDDGAQSLRSPGAPGSILERLLNLYWKGLKEPLKFFPRSSYAFARTALNPKRKSEPMNAARTAWEGNDFTGVAGEGAEDYNRIFFLHDDPLDADFEALALQVFQPIIEVREEL